MIYFATPRNFVKAHAMEFAVALVIVLALLLLAFCSRPHRDPVDAATIETQQKVGNANTNSSAARVEDAVKAEQQKEELHDAIENSTGGDDARRRSGCVILRQQNRNAAAVSAGC